MMAGMKTRDLSAWIQRRPTAAAALVLSALALIFFHRLGTGDLAFRDPGYEFYPLRLLWEWVRRGVFPLWNPYPGLGAPLAGSGFPGVWYPLNGPLVFGLGLSAGMAVKVYTFIHYPLAGLSMWLLLRALGARTEAALTGAVGYAFSGYLVSMHYAENLLPGLALMPLALALALRDERRSWLLAAVVTGLIALGGDPQGFAITAGLCPLAALVLGPAWPERKSPAFKKRTPALALHTLLYLTVSFAAGAAELLPAWDVLANSARGPGLDWPTASTWSLHPLRIVELILARPFGSLWPVDRYWGGFMADPGLSFPMSMSAYLGVWTVIAAGVAWRRRWRDRRVLFFSALALGSLALALGRHTPLFGLLWRWVPGLDAFRFPEKYLVGVTLAAAALTGLGTDAVINGAGRAAPDGPRSASRWAAPGILLLAAAVLLAGRGWIQGPLGGLLAPWLETGPGARVAPAGAAEDVIFSLARTLGLLGLGLALLRWSRGKAGSVIAFAPALLLFLDLWQGNAALAPTVPQLYSQRSYWADRILSLEGNGPAAVPWCERSCAPAGRFRVFRDNAIPLPLALAARDAEGLVELKQERVLRWQRDTLKPNLGVADGLENFGGINAAADRRLQLFRDIGGIGLLPGFNVKYAIVPEELAATLDGATILGQYQGTALARFNDTLPRAYWVAGAVAVRTDEQAAAALAAIDWRRQAVLGPPAPALPPPAPGPAAALVPAAIDSYLPNRVQLTVTAPAPGWLVLNDAVAPGWRAMIDGAPADVLRANLLVRAVAVGSGAHRVVFTYRPPRLTLGLALTIAAYILVLAVKVVAPAARRKKSSAGDPPTKK
jgi:hypothetical protein